jgi:hypothetical protein
VVDRTDDVAVDTELVVDAGPTDVGVVTVTVDGSGALD